MASIEGHLHSDLGSRNFRISVISPVKNPGHLIMCTVDSISCQIGLGETFEVEFIYVDGQSTDGSYEWVVERCRDVKGLILKSSSRPDKSMYDALSSGLSQATGQIVCYINAGDYFSLGAFETVRQVFGKFACQWITFLRGNYNPDGSLVRVSLPTRLTPKLTRAGHYGLSRPGLGFIQQEVTFWGRELQDNLDWSELASYRLAGDSYLWSAFMKSGPPLIVNAVVGGHRKHPGQLSEDLSNYRAEMLLHTVPPSVSTQLSAFVEWFISHLPPRIRRAWIADQLVEWDERRLQWVRSSSRESAQSPS